jgi:hypothetical protein
MKPVYHVRAVGPSRARRAVSLHRCRDVQAPSVSPVVCPPVGRATAPGGAIASQPELHAAKMARSRPAAPLPRRSSCHAPTSSLSSSLIRICRTAPPHQLSVSPRMPPARAHRCSHPSSSALSSTVKRAATPLGHAINAQRRRW